MARSAVPTAALRRALADLKTGPKHRGPRRGVMLAPRPVTVEAWESVAAPMQAALLAACADDRDERQPAPADPMDVSSKYR